MPQLPQVDQPNQCLQLPIQSSNSIQLTQLSQQNQSPQSTTSSQVTLPPQLSQLAQLTPLPHSPQLIQLTTSPQLKHSPELPQLPHSTQLSFKSSLSKRSTTLPNLPTLPHLRVSPCLSTSSPLQSSQSLLPFPHLPSSSILSKPSPLSSNVLSPLYPMQTSKFPEFLFSKTPQFGPESPQFEPLLQSLTSSELKSSQMSSNISQSRKYLYSSVLIDTTPLFPPIPTYSSFARPLKLSISSRMHSSLQSPIFLTIVQPLSSSPLLLTTSQISSYCLRSSKTEYLSSEPKSPYQNLSPPSFTNYNSSFV
ncbi:hypothetical protein LUQ84_003004 [Hamiltosporidium tvaerminnensis]|nr:hypothetical protein LUQ84_003004 [Hamiltosporidium tvaerminnensis]